MKKLLATSLILTQLAGLSGAQIHFENQTRQPNSNFSILWWPRRQQHRRSLTEGISPDVEMKSNRMRVGLNCTMPLHYDTCEWKTNMVPVKDGDRFVVSKESKKVCLRNTCKWPHGKNTMCIDPQCLEWGNEPIYNLKRVASSS